MLSVRLPRQTKQNKKKKKAKVLEQILVLVNRIKKKRKETQKQKQKKGDESIVLEQICAVLVSFALGLGEYVSFVERILETLSALHSQ